MTAAATSPDDVLKFWFGDIVDGWTSADKQQLWFGFNREDDAQLSARFGALVRQALDGKLTNWTDNPQHTTAYILLLDQMTRAIYRGDAKAFAGDAPALAACKDGIARGDDKKCPPVYRMFFYMPLEHSENLDAQNTCVAMFRNMAEEFPPLREKILRAVDATEQHRSIIQQFGRFPHRNAALGRKSTPEETAFLQKHAGFGQAPKARA